MQLIKQSTAVNISMGPFLDSADGNTEKTSLTIAQADIRLSKNGGAYAQTNNSAGATHQEKGNYQVPLDTTDTGTLGRFRVYIHVATALAVWDDFTVLPANIYDSLVGDTDKLQVDVVEILVAVATTIADTILKRDMSAVTGEAARSPLNALRHIRNKWSISGSTKTVYKEDDSTSAWTSSVTTSDDASPITGDDPA